VQSGGSFDIDFDVKDPHQKVLLSGEKERQGDYVLTANTVGEYSFCFENDMSTLTDKLVDFDILVESEPRREAPVKVGRISEQTSALEESIFRLNWMMTNIKRLQNTHHTNENRGFSIVRSTQKLVYYYFSCPFSSGFFVVVFSGTPFSRPCVSSAWQCAFPFSLLCVH